MASGLCLVVVPFFLAYSSSFWLKTNVYREQPKVIFEHKFFGYVNDVFFSSMASVNHLYQEQLRIPTARSIEIDANDDGLVDRFRLELTVPLLEEEFVLSSSIMCFFNAKLSGDRGVKAEFEALAYVQAASPAPGSSLYVDSDFVLNQRWPLRAKGGYQLLYDEDVPLLDPQRRDVETAQLNMARIVAAYRDRNATMDLDRTYTVWTPTSAHASHFNITLNLRIPTGDVLYTPNVSEVLKDAWIKYLSVFLVVAYLLDALCSFVYRNYLLDDTTAEDDVDLIATPYTMMKVPPSS